jgi:hypothetical protein
VSVDYYFKRSDGAMLCVTNKPYDLPVAFPDGVVEPGRSTSALIYAALAGRWPELPVRDVIAKVERIEQFMRGETVELLSEYDVHGMHEPVVTIGRGRESER